MHLERTAEQAMLYETALRFFRAHPQTASWQEMAALGFVAAAVSEEGGGLGGRAADVAPVCEAIGVSGAQVPYFALALLPARLCELAGAREPALLDSFIAGATRVSVAHSERELVFAPEEPSARVDGTERAIEGIKHRAWGAAQAQTLLVSAVGGGGFGWYAVETGAAGVEVKPRHGPDGLTAAGVALRGAACRPIAAGAPARAALAQAIALASVGVLAQSVGAMRRLLDLTIEWLEGRSQFGRPLWANQVLQHRAVDMFVALEEARSMLNLAIHACDAMSGSERLMALHAAKAHVARAARFVGQQAVHLHGAMGLTEECAAGPAYRQLEALQSAFGGADYHVAACAGLATAPAACVRPSQFS